jgi:hypothetical protein
MFHANGPSVLNSKGRSQPVCDKDDQRVALAPSVQQKLRQRFSVSGNASFSLIPGELRSNGPGSVIIGLITT